MRIAVLGATGVVGQEILHNGIIANPNCVAIILTVAVAPIHRAVGIRRIVVSTYQSASGAGLAAMQELQSQTKDRSRDARHRRRRCRTRSRSTSSRTTPPSAPTAITARKRK